MDEKRKHPDSGFKWIILVCCFVNQMGTVGLMISLSVLYVSWLEEFQEGKALTSWILSLGCALNLAFCPVPASLAARFGFRAVGFIGALLTSAGLIASAFATSVTFVIVSLGFVTGAGCSFAYLPSVAMVVLYFEKRRAMAMGIAITGVGVGSFILAPFLNYLEMAYTWRGAHLILGGISLNMCVTALLFRPVEMASDDIPVKNDQYQSTGTVWNKEEEAEDTQINHETPEIRIEEVSLCNDGNSVSEEKQSLIRDFQIKTASRDGSVILYDGHELASYLKSGLTDDRADNTNPFRIIDTSSMKSKPNLSLHNISLSALSSKDMQKPHSSLPDLNLRQKHQQSHRSLPKSLQNAEVIVSASLRGFNHLLDESEEKERRCHQKVTEITQNVNEKKDIKRNKSLLSKFLSSNAVKTNLEILNDKVFVLFCISNFIACLSFYTPVIFLVDRAVHQGIDKSIGAVLISANGCGNILGRISTGWLADYCCTNHMLMFIVGLGAQGVGTMLSSLCGSSVILHGIYAMFLGYFMGVFTILAPLVTVDLKGVSNLAAAYGLVLTFTGTGSLIGPPISGSLFDWTHSYSLSYIINGVFQITSAIIIVPLLCKRNRGRNFDTK